MAKLLQSVPQNWKRITDNLISTKTGLEVFVNIRGDIEISIGASYALELTSEEAKALANDILYMQKGLEDESNGF